MRFSKAAEACPTPNRLPGVHPFFQMFPCGIALASTCSRWALPNADMTTKDFVYLGLIATTALVFYCHGFFSGVNRSRRIYESLFGGAEDDAPEQTLSRTFERQTGLQVPSSLERSSEIRGDFGNN